VRITALRNQSRLKGRQDFLTSDSTNDLTENEYKHSCRREMVPFSSHIDDTVRARKA